MFQSNDERSQNNKDSITFNHSLRRGSKYSSQRRLENNASSDIITLEKPNMLDSPNYANNGKHLHIGTSNSIVPYHSKKNNKMKEMVKVYRINNKDSEFPKNTMQRVFDRIDKHLEKYSEKNSSRNKIVKNRDKSLVLPNLSSRPNAVEVIQSVDIRNSKVKDRSLGRIRKIPSNLQTNNLKITSLKASPMFRSKFFNQIIRNSKLYYFSNIQYLNYAEFHIFYKFQCII